MRGLEAATCDWQVVALNLGLTASGQGSQVDCPGSAWYSYALQAHGAALPRGQLLPGGHGSPDTDSRGQYLPAGHSPHSGDPSFGANLAGGHGEHDDEPLAELNCPMGQGLQAASEGDPVASLYVPALHAVQAALPLTFENVPAAHGAQ